MVAAATVEDYLAALPAEVQPTLREVRRRIAAALPDSTEKISYAIPAVQVDGRTVVFYGAWKHHLGVYPVPVAEGELEEALAPYRSTKDTLRFPYTEPFPYELVVRVATERAAAR